jgi:malonyl CoA-acyl carrier protein transacylase
LEQLVSGETTAVEEACVAMKKQVQSSALLLLPVGGAFHSPMMEPAGKNWLLLLKRLPSLLRYISKS